MFHGLKIVSCPLTAAAAVLTCTGCAEAYTLKTLHSFCHLSQCVDGENPFAGLLMDGKGNLFGTAALGGAFGQGTAFELTSGKKGKWKYEVLYSFCLQANCADGSEPLSPLIVDKDDNLYGTTAEGGAHAQGAIFELVRNGKNWIEVVLYSFCSTGGSGCTDGARPSVGLTYAGQSSGTPYDGSSALFGTTQIGGDANLGTAYQFKSAFESVIHSFNPASGPGPLIMDRAGNLYGNTLSGGIYEHGRIYLLDASNNWHQNVLYDFCAQDPCMDGETPEGGLFMDAGGTLFGATRLGGNSDRGVAFSLRSNGTNYTKLYDFCARKKCSDGDDPLGDFTMDAAGRIFGTTLTGGKHFGGTIFRLQDNKKWSEDVLSKFCEEKHCKDGGKPTAPVILDKHGNLFGATSYGGDAGAGTVFELTP